ncbi:LLM class flavin-dependent oxidoreductase [Mycolicibacterium sp. S2-37]|uniref:LLM class flavin-dependent oxidoreductase n=1 Tax=Mycolicibacterium sp. S2-37 TaxID=2810297 RepID=UPI001A94AE97|nr:LLM class flavin-dependent oxidoreductase [Mycolicibacterium sp. S2-37]MBO0676471.1 LLM class flavin-dependent oxidoreductase [Mycolicibacterium sp. S2-37]
MGATGTVQLAVALDGTGWHPSSWREPDARPTELLTARYWTDLILEAERGRLDFVTIEDALALQSGSGVHGRLDAVLIAARVGPVTRHIGLVPTVITTHTEPFHTSKAIATLDFVTSGRAGVRVKVAADAESAAHFGRREVSQIDLLGEAADYVEVLRRLWDSWEDDAEIRDVATGRFIDRTKLHYIDFESATFSVKGPSITPRPPQGQPIVAALGHTSPALRLIANSADVGFITPLDAAETARTVEAVAARRPDTVGPVRLFADLVVFLDDSPQAARARKQRLDDLTGTDYRSDAEVFVGSPGELADLVVARSSSGVAGFRLRPATLPHDLLQITRGLMPELQRRGAVRGGYHASTLRGLLGLARPANRYANT